MKPSTVLRKARKLIERGWCRWTKKRRYRINGPMHYCSIGAIEAVGGNKQHKELLRRVLGCGIIAFNDDLDRRKPQVLRAFDRAIKLAEQEGR